ncbi:hypothetical protein [Paraburkholderia agricolaris]|uniref:hypothetical protein n=1 Tax=Paraburkholderia agricolaris TaxID=2152888 RepID=UPI001291099B|nr:hypothetical protein [Paraburkholderia agricolaris]
MARSPNDDRSDSMNPNNPAYDASEDNRLNQIGANYDDYDDLPARSSGLSFSYYSKQIEPASSPQVVELEVIVPPQPVRVPGLNLLIVSNDGKRKSVKVDAGDIEEAVNDAATIWDSRPLVYLALYDKKNVYVERTRSKQFSPEVLRSIVELGELEELITLAADQTSSARRGLSDTESRYGRQAPVQALERYGACYSALQGLRAERSVRIEELHARGYGVTEETAQKFAQEGKLTQVVDASAQLVRDLQSGKTRLDPIAEAFSRSERILDVKG